MSLISELREKIEDLDTRIDALSADAKPLRDQLANLDRSRSKLESERAGYKARLAELTAKPRVSDHAVIRYLERKYGFTFEDVRDEMLTPTVLSAMDAGAEGVNVNGGVLKIKGRTITTYVEQGA